MKKRSSALWTPVILIAMSLGACAEPLAPAPGYLQLHDAIFAKTCASSACHQGAKGQAGLSFDDPAAVYAHLLDGIPTLNSATLGGLALVTPGQPDASLLYLKLAWTPAALAEVGLGAAMPLSTGFRLGPESLAAVRAWIAAGAPWDGAAVTLDKADAGSDEIGYIPCEATDEEGLRACFPAPTDPAQTLRLFTPPMRIPAGSEKVICSFLDAAPDAIRLKSAKGLQMAGGHHAAVFVGLTAPPEQNPADCSEVSMGALRFVAGAGGAGGVSTILPAGTALTIGKGQRIVIQSHYINVTPDEITVMDVVDLALTDTTESPINIDPFTIVDSEFEVPSGAVDYTRVKECVVHAPIDIHMLLGHTHDYGVHFSFDLIRKSGPKADIPEQLYYATDGPTLRDNPEIRFFDAPGIPLDVGDVLRVTCRWTNPTETPLGWPEEMCVALMYYSPGEGFLMCDTEDVSPVVETGGEDGCAAPGDAGNALGIGKFCTPGGGECADTPAPTLCLAEFSDDANYCSVILCEDDDACGEGATCVHASAGSACVPEGC